MPVHKQRQRNHPDAETTTEQPGRAESQIDEKALEETLADIDEALAEQELTEADAIAEFDAISSKADTEAFNEKYASLDLTAEIVSACCMDAAVLSTTAGSPVRSHIV